MFHKIKSVRPMEDKRLRVIFLNGTTKTYDMTPLMKKNAFIRLNDASFFNEVKVDAGGYGISWNDDIDLCCDELWENGVVESTPFDDLMSFADASELWGLSESTLRKAISYGKLIPGVDARKYGKQWIVTRSAMEREYGKPVSA